MLETDLYLPVKELFEDLGYQVHSEINNIDILAIKEDEAIAIELKTSLNLKLILQAIDRQRITPIVFVAIPMLSSRQLNSLAFTQKKELLTRLELGLILVSLEVKKPYAQIVFEPKPYLLSMKTKKDKRRNASALKEVSQRHGDHNKGGSKGKLVTAYRERALLVVYHLKMKESLSVQELRECTQNEKVLLLLNKNYYGWFEKVERGVYRLSEKGHEAYESYERIIQKIK